MMRFIMVFSATSGLLPSMEARRESQFEIKTGGAPT